jgi:hypothetical protein
MQQGKRPVRERKAMAMVIRPDPELDDEGLGTSIY